MSYPAIEVLEHRRLLWAGQPDLTFGTGGETVVTVPPIADPTVTRNLLAFRSDGGLLFDVRDPYNASRIVALDAAGRLDTNFAGSGVLDAGSDVLVAYDAASGRILVLTTEDHDEEATASLRMIDASGADDPSFGDAGELQIPFRRHAGLDSPETEFQRFDAIAFRSDGSIALLGVNDTFVNGESGGVLAVLRSDGNPATGFGADGRVDFGSGQFESSLVAGPGNTLYVLQSSYVSATTTSFHAIRFDGDGTLSSELAGIDSDSATYDPIGLSAVDGGVSVVAFDGPTTGFDRAQRLDLWQGERTQTTLEGVTDYVTPPSTGRSAIRAVVLPDHAVQIVGRRDLGTGSVRYDAEGAVILGYANDGFVESVRTGVNQSADGRVVAFDGQNGTLSVESYAPGTGRAVPITIAASVIGKTLTVTGTPGDDAVRITYRASEDRYVVRGNGFVRSFPHVQKIDVLLGDGNDALTVEDEVGAVWADGGLGNDTLRDGGADDALIGNAGDDWLYGNGGADQLVGSGGDDFLFGGAGDDYAEGSGGRDSLNGNAQHDTLLGNGGRDTLNGAGGNDLLLGGPDSADDIRGGTGTDRATEDEKDLYSSVEELL